MNRRPHVHPDLIYSPGTQVVALVETVGQEGRLLHPRGAVCVVVKSPGSAAEPYRVRFLDGLEIALPVDQVMLLAEFKQGAIDDPGLIDRANLYSRVIYRCVIGSRAYGLSDSESDTDRRGIYLPPAELQWSLYGVPEQLENDATQEAYWELRKFLVLALKANPNVLECLFSPLVEFATPLAEELLAMRTCFVSRLIYQTYNGYVASQFKKMSADLRNHGQVKRKHAMHLIRLLLSGIEALRSGVIPVRVERHREELLSIKSGQIEWDALETWRRRLHEEFDAAYRETYLPERPDYESANAFLIRARRQAASESE